MYCPLMSARNGFVECREKNCTWWNAGYECCAIRSIDDSLTSIDREGIILYEPEDDCENCDTCECEFDEEEH